jgi:hypothetical protein
VRRAEGGEEDGKKGRKEDETMRRWEDGRDAGDGLFSNSM